MAAVLFASMTLGWASCALIAYQFGLLLDVLYIPLFSCLFTCTRLCATISPNASSAN